MDSHCFEHCVFHTAVGDADLPWARRISSALIDKIDLLLQGSIAVAQEAAAAPEDS